MAVSCSLFSSVYFLLMPLILWKRALCLAAHVIVIYAEWPWLQVCVHLNKILRSSLPVPLYRHSGQAPILFFFFLIEVLVGLWCGISFWCTIKWFSFLIYICTYLLYIYTFNICIIPFLQTNSIPSFRPIYSWLDVDRPISGFLPECNHFPAKRCCIDGSFLKDPPGYTSPPFEQKIELLPSNICL